MAKTTNKLRNNHFFGPAKGSIYPCQTNIWQGRFTKLIQVQDGHQRYHRH